MSITSPDASLNHLYPAFREKLIQVLDEVAQATGEPWFMMEGYRSPERQTYLYAQGRTRPGRIVTWVRTPKYHGTGLAADSYPRRRSFSAPMSFFERYREIYEKHGLCNPAWAKGDRGHVQLSDPAIRLKALAWVRAGFPPSPDLPAPPVAPEITVLVNGEAIPDADASIENGHVLVALRPIADAFDWAIAKTWKQNGEWKGELVSDTLDVTVPMIMKENKGFVPASQLPIAVVWDGKTKRLLLKSSDK